MKLKNIITYLIAGFIALQIISVQAQDKKAPAKEERSVNEKKETVIVTANRTTTEIKEVGKSFTVISREEIERSNHRDILDMLKRVPGINISKSGPNGLSSIYIRGNEGYYTKVLIDGSPIEDASGTQVNYSNFINSLNLDNVEKIEVIRGPQSTLYGSDAMGGVINIITKKGSGKLFGGAVRQEFGKDRFNKSTLSLNGADGGFNYSLSLSQESQETYSTTNHESSRFNGDDDYYHATNLNYNFGYKVNDNLKFSLSGLYSSSDVELDNNSSHNETFNQMSVIRPSITLMNLLDNRLDIEFAYSHTDSRRTGDTVDAFSQTHNYSVFNTLEISDWNTLSFGAEYKSQSSYSDESPSKKETVYKEYFLQEQLSYEDWYFLTLGGRFSDHSEFGGHYTYQLAQAFHIKETGTKLHMSYGTAYRAPSHFELFTPLTDYGGGLIFEGGDPNFKPETSETFDIGFDQELYNGSLKFGATYFYVETEDKIAYIITDPMTYSGGYKQLGSARSYGLESYIQYNFNEDLFTKFIYTRTHTEYKLQYEDVRAPRVPEDAFTILINWQATQKLNFDVEFNYVGNRFSDTSGVKLESYTLAHFSATYQLYENVKLFAKINNLFDEQYEYAQGFNTYGRSLYAGFEFKF